MNFGIDISTYQNGIDLVKAKNEGVSFVIIRGGFTGTSKGMAKDDRFEEHYKNARNANLNVGVYFYSRATSYDEGRKEAEFLYNNCLKDKVFEYPICIDIEDSYYQVKASKDDIDNAINGFCEYIESKGGYASIYCNLNWANNHMNYDKLAKKYDFWLAYWGTSKPSNSKYGNYGIWQYGGETNLIRSNKIASKVCDQNYSYKDYPNIMKNKTLNDFTEKKIVEDIVDDTIEEPNILKQVYNLAKKIIDYIFSKLKKET